MCVLATPPDTLLRTCPEERGRMEAMGRSLPRGTCTALAPLLVEVRPINDGCRESAKCEDDSPRG